MIPREAVEEEIERSYVRPSLEPTQTDDPSRVTWRRALIAALPTDVSARLVLLHDMLEDGQELSPEERAEMARLEHEMAQSAAQVLQEVIRRERAAQ
jgi:hypothetical protein